MIDIPIEPNRKPDTIIDHISFWWEEGILTHDIAGSFHFDSNTWTYYSPTYNQYRGIQIGFVINLRHLQETYVEWALEKGFNL